MKKQAGFTLIEAGMVAAIGAGAAVMYAQQQQDEIRDAQSGRVATEFTQLNSALNELLRQSSESVGLVGGLSRNTVYSGDDAVNALKPTTCGGLQSGTGFLPCDFPTRPSYSDASTQYSWTVTEYGGAGSGVWEARTSVTPYVKGGEPRPLIAADAVVKSIGSSAAMAATGAMPSYTFDETTGNVEFSTRNVSADFFKSDGTDWMTGPLNMRDPSGTGVGQNIRMFGGNVEMAGGDVTGADIVEASVFYDRDDPGRTYVIDPDKLSRVNDLIVNDDLTVNGTFVASRMVDRENFANDVDPSGTSDMNNLRLAGNLNITGIAEFAQSIDVNGNVNANAFCDRGTLNMGGTLGNPCVNPNGTSSMNRINFYSTGGVAIDANQNRIADLPDPTTATDAANKRYVDGMAVYSGAVNGASLESCGGLACGGGVAVSYDGAGVYQLRFNQAVSSVTVSPITSIVSPHLTPSSDRRTWDVRFAQLACGGSGGCGWALAATEFTFVGQPQ